MTGEYMRGYQDGTTIAKGVAESLLAQASSEKATLMRRIDELCAEVERLRWQGEQLFDKTLELGTENAKLREFANEMFKEIILWNDYQMGSERKKHFIDKGIELVLRGWA